MSEKRTNVILGYITQKRKATLKELNALFPDYNEMTIRRDLIMLEKNGYIERIHGGAVIKEDSIPVHDYRNQRITRNLSEKQRIALKAITLIKDSMSIYLDAGTSSFNIAKALPNMPLFVTTNDPFIALELQKHSQIEIILTGGSLNKSISSLSGPVSMYAIDKINIDLAFMGTTGVDVKYGFSNASLNECELKKKVISSAKKKVVMVDSSKFYKTYPYTFANFEDIDCIICDKQPNEEFSAIFQEKGVEVLHL